MLTCCFFPFLPLFFFFSFPLARIFAVSLLDTRVAPYDPCGVIGRPPLPAICRAGHGSGSVGCWWQMAYQVCLYEDDVINPQLTHMLEDCASSCSHEACAEAVGGDGNADAQA